MASPCYLREGTGVWAGQEHTSWRAGQPHNGSGQLPLPTPNNSHNFRNFRLNYYASCSPLPEEGSVWTVRCGVSLSLLSLDYQAIVRSLTFSLNEMGTPRRFWTWEWYALNYLLTGSIWLLNSLKQEQSWKCEITYRTTWYWHSVCTSHEPRLNPYTKKQSKTKETPKNKLWSGYNYKHAFYINQKTEMKRLGNCPNIHSK